MDIEPQYLAGVADSDGSFSIAIKRSPDRSPYYRAVFQLTWSFDERTLQVITAIKEKYGGSFFIQKVGRKNYPNSRPTIKYSVESRKVMYLLRDILPYVKLKKKQVSTLIR